MPLRLIIEDDEGATTIVPLGKEAITIGRQQGNTIQLTEKNVSRTHARLFPESEAWMIEDLNSYNGIKVNDKPVDGRMKLREGDIVQIGDYHLAITEDVDKRTLNYDRQGMAANDGDPLLASSSADLPRLSPDEIHALSSGPQPITPAPSPMMVDSGPVPATPYAAGYEEPKKKGSGLLIAVGLLLLGAGAVGVFMLQKGGGEDPPASASAGKAPADADTPPPKPAPTKATDVAPTPPPEPTPAADAGAEPDPIADPPPDPVPEPLPPPTKADPTPPPDDDPVVIDDDPTPKPTPKPTVKKKRQPKPQPQTPKPTPPKDTGPSADELLADAKKKAFKDPSASYKLAKQAYGKKASQRALSVMGTAACRMGDKNKAKSAYNKLRGSMKEDMKKMCAGKGINL